MSRGGGSGHGQHYQLLKGSTILSRTRLTIALILVIASFSGIIVCIGHGVAPGVLFLIPGRFLGVTVLSWIGIGALLSGRSLSPASGGKSLLTVGVVAFGVAAIRLTLISEVPPVTALTVIPLGGASLWLLLETWRERPTRSWRGWWPAPEAMLPRDFASAPVPMMHADD